jgi:hypothetical protein
VFELVPVCRRNRSGHMRQVREQPLLKTLRASEPRPHITGDGGALYGWLPKAWSPAI